jgi:hypothetical protein
MAVELSPDRGDSSLFVSVSCSGFGQSQLTKGPNTRRPNNSLAPLTDRGSLDQCFTTSMFKTG